MDEDKDVMPRKAVPVLDAVKAWKFVDALGELDKMPDRPWRRVNEVHADILVLAKLFGNEGKPHTKGDLFRLGEVAIKHVVHVLNTELVGGVHGAAITNEEQGAADGR